MLLEQSDTKLNVGIIGCGTLVQDYYTLVLLRVPGIALRAVADLNAANARKVAGETGAEEMTVEALVESCDWVLVTTPPEVHADIAERALGAGCNVVVEKPFVTTGIDARRLVNLAGASNRALHVGQLRRFFPPTELARDILLSGLLGTAIKIEAFEGGRFNWSTQSGYVGRSAFGGVLFDTGSHIVDQALFAVGLDDKEISIEVDRVCKDKKEPSHEIDCHFNLVSGATRVACRLLLSRAQTFANMVRIHAANGIMEFDCGFQGGVRLCLGGRWVRVLPSNTMHSPAEAFLTEYKEIFARPNDARTIASRMLGQVAILERLHQHEE
jgi:predicted dehydrogenase